MQSTELVIAIYFLAFCDLLRQLLQPSWLVLLRLCIPTFLDLVSSSLIERERETLTTLDSHPVQTTNTRTETRALAAMASKPSKVND